MKNYKMNYIKKVLFIFITFLFLSGINLINAQEIRWLSVSELQSFLSEYGSEYEGSGTTGNTNWFSWPAQYGIDQNTLRMKGLWIGCRNFYDPTEQRDKGVKVIGTGPRPFADRPNQIFGTEIKLVAKNYHPSIIVDDQPATVLDNYDMPDSIDENMAADRMVIIKFNTSIGVSVTKKVMVFANSEHGNYYIHDYLFENTGIYNAAGQVYEQTLNDLWFYFMYRWAFAGVTSDGFGSTWGSFESVWGENTINYAFGQNPNSPSFTDPSSPVSNLRGYYSWAGPSTRRSLSYDEDWGCPNESEDGTLGTAKFAGCVTLHADTSPNNDADDLFQPRTTWYISSDLEIMSGNVSQYDEVFMQNRYDAMSEGHPDISHEEAVGDNYPFNYSDSYRNSGGGTSQGQGYGPYTLAPGQSVRIVFAEAIDGISWEKCREVGANWLQYYTSSGSPSLVLPNGSTTTSHNQYKKDWMYTGKDSIVNTFQKAYRNFQSNYTLATPPPPPEEFTVTSGGDRIHLSWSDNAAEEQNFDGYVIYRSSGNVMDDLTRYVKIFECGRADAVHEFDDVNAVRGFDYYYYIQSKSDGSDNELDPGTPLYSSLFWTITSLPATLQRPSADFLSELRVVPNPYDIRSRLFQFGDQSLYDRLAFYGLPPKCALKIFTERGDLIWEKDHSNGTGDELWDSKTSYGQIIASGIYILYVEVTEDIYAEEDKYARFDILDDDLNVVYRAGDLLYQRGDLIYQKGQSKFRKFVVIR